MGRRNAEFKPNRAWFDTALRRSDVEKPVDAAAARVLAAAQAAAPVDSGDYKRGLTIRTKQAKYRRVLEVTATDEKSLIIEARTGNLARAAKAGKR